MGYNSLSVEETADAKTVPAIVEAGGIDVRRIEVEVTNDRGIGERSSRPVAAVATSIGERAIVVAAGQQEIRSSIRTSLSIEAVIAF